MSGPVTIDMVRCTACGHIDSTTCIVCPECLGDEMTPHGVPGAGTLVTWTTIRRAPTRFREQAPYVVCVVDLDSGQRVTGRIDTVDGAESGARVVTIPSSTPGIRLFTLS